MDNTYSWQEALNYCESLVLADYTDWRLPDREELRSIADYENYAPSIDETFFPNTQADGYWSSTTCAYSKASSWYVDFNYGGDGYSVKTGARYVRAVRGGRYSGSVDIGDGTFYDPSTGLMWEIKSDDGGARDMDHAYTWQDALEYCENLNLANYTDWRLPDREELRSIANYSNYNPSIDETQFPNTRADGYWSSTTCAYSTSSAWYVDFNYGGDGYGTKTGTRYVRAVRTGQGACGPVAIAQSSLSVQPGTTFVQWGTGFTPDRTATLHFRKPDGTEYPTLAQPLDAMGQFEIEYTAPYDQPLGTYAWWAIDNATGCESNEVTYEISLGDGLDLSGRVLDRQTQTGVVDALVSLGSNSCTTGADGRFEFIDISPTDGTALTVSKSGYIAYADVVEVQAGTRQAALEDILLVREEVGKPVVTRVKAKYNGLFLSSLEIYNEITANVDWNGTAAGKVRFLANGVLVEELEGSTSPFSCRFNMAEYFTPAFKKNANYATVIAVNDSGVESDPVTEYFTIIPIPDPVKLVIPDADTVYFDTKFVGIDFEFPPKPVKHVIDLPVLGKFGAEFAANASFDYTFGDGDWEVAIGAGATAKQGKRGRRPVIPMLTRTPKVKLYIGNKEISGKLEAGARGTATISRGIIFDEVFGHGEIEAKLELTRYGILDLCGPGLSDMASRIPGLNKLLKNVSIIIYAIPGVEGDLVYVLQPEFDFKSLEFTGKIGIEAAYEPDWKICKARIYVGGEPSLTAGFPGDFFKYLRFRAYAGAKLETWIIVVGPYEVVFVDVRIPSDARSADTWREGSDTMTVALKVSDGNSSEFQTMDRSYLKAGPERFVVYGDENAIRTKSAETALEAFRSIGRTSGSEEKTRQSVSAIRQADLPIVENVFPSSDPALAGYGQELMLLYVKDNGSPEELQFADIAFTRFDGADWTTPASIAPDTRAEFNSQVRFDGNGDAIAVWERVRDLDFTEVDIAAMAAQMEIVWSRWDRNTGTWTTPEPLTDNAYLDYSPRLCGPMADGNLLLAWSRNTANLLMGEGAPGAPENSRILWAEWDALAKNWSAPAVLADNLAYELSETLEGAGNRAVFAWTKDEDGNTDDSSDQEIYYCEWTSGTWGPPTRFTSDAHSDRDVRAAVSSSGDVYLTWRRGESLVMDRNFAGAPEEVRPDSASAGFSDYALALGPSGNLVLIWQETSEDGSDAYCRVYDPASQTWCKDERLFADSSLERSFSPVWDIAGNLTLAYNKVEIAKVTKTVTLEGGENVTIPNVPEPGRADLAVFKRALVKDVAILPDAFSVDGDNCLHNGIMTLSATVENQGDLAVQDLRIAFYDGDPNQGGTEIGTATIDGWMEGHSETAVSVDWTAPQPPVDLTLYVVADPDNAVAEFSEFNNMASAPIGGTDLAVAYLSSTVSADGAVRVYAKVQNVGTVFTSGTGVSVRKAGTDVDIVSAAIPDLAPGQLAQAALDIPSIVTVEGDSLYSLVLNDPALADDVDEWNNSVTFAVTYVAPSTGIAGDANNDGQVGLADVLAILKAKTGVNVPGFNPSQADVCQTGALNGKVDMIDGIVLMQYVAGIRTNL